MKKLCHSVVLSLFIASTQAWPTGENNPIFHVKREDGLTGFVYMEENVWRLFFNTTHDASESALYYFLKSASKEEGFLKVIYLDDTEEILTLDKEYSLKTSKRLTPIHKANPSPGLIETY
ncbi:MAG: hypothetical protein N0C82_17405 [Candidatus Thiodiazotropha endolucinida]|nr:hypothetical protein [Candidatus Thiodiazotropha taylori]MCW4297089.1 hypothetical protein [Candidatus Thiodiazotropha endolucinida]